MDTLVGETGPGGEPSGRQLTCSLQRVYWQTGWTSPWVVQALKDAGPCLVRLGEGKSRRIRCRVSADALGMCRMAGGALPGCTIMDRGIRWLLWHLAAWDCGHEFGGRPHRCHAGLRGPVCHGQATTHASMLGKWTCMLRLGTQGGSRCYCLICHRMCENGGSKLGWPWLMSEAGGVVPVRDDGHRTGRAGHVGRRGGRGGGKEPRRPWHAYVAVLGTCTCG